VMMSLKPYLRKPAIPFWVLICSQTEREQERESEREQKTEREREREPCFALSFVPLFLLSAGKWSIQFWTGQVSPNCILLTVFEKVLWKIHTSIWQRPLHSSLVPRSKVLLSGGQWRPASFLSSLQISCELAEGEDLPPLHINLRVLGESSGAVQSTQMHQARATGWGHFFLAAAQIQHWQPDSITWINGLKLDIFLLF
jgi:hypothetical protein